MAIIERVRPGAPLSQGDILKGIDLFATKASWLETGGEPARMAARMCLVLSRPCVLAHKRHIQVAAIEKYPDAVPRTIESFDDVLVFLTGARDGTHSPDVFYLGQLPGTLNWTPEPGQPNKLPSCP